MPKGVIEFTYEWILSQVKKEHRVVAFDFQKSKSLYNQDFWAKLNWFSL